MSRLLNKRQFIKAGIAGSAGLCLGLSSFSSFGSREILNRVISVTSGTKGQSRGEREAKHYIVSPRGVKCLLCPNECQIKPGETGLCRTRIHRDNKLYLLAYGNPCAVHVDPVEKKPLFHFLPGSASFSIATAGCNLACLNCQNWEISQKSPEETRNYDLMPEKVVVEAFANKCKSIAYTYSDPVAFFEYTHDTAKIAREKGMKNVLVSAGYIHEEPLREWCRYIDAAHIDLKSFSNDIYQMLNAGKLDPVLNTLRILKDEGVWLEIVNLVIPTWTDDLEMIKKMTEWLTDNGFQDTPLHFSRFHPQHKLLNLPPTPVETLEKARDTALSAGIHFVYIGNVPGSSAENTWCPGCKKVVIGRKGYVISKINLDSGKCSFCKRPIPGVWN